MCEPSKGELWRLENLRVNVQEEQKSLLCGDTAGISPELKDFIGLKGSLNGESLLNLCFFELWQTHASSCAPRKETFWLTYHTLYIYTNKFIGMPQADPSITLVPGPWPLPEGRPSYIMLVSFLFFSFFFWAFDAFNIAICPLGYAKNFAISETLCQNYATFNLMRFDF